MGEVSSRLWSVIERLRRVFVYFAVLRPSYFFGFLIIYLPLTAAAEWIPGNSLLANLFVEYGLWKGFWFGFALSGAVWALMLTTCLMLDFARDRQPPSASPWLPAPAAADRWITIPMRHKQTFVLFSLIGAPAVIIVIWKAASAVGAAVGLALGWLLSFYSMNLVAALVYAENRQYQVFPWRPFGLNIKWVAKLLRPVFARGMKLILAPDEIFEPSTGYLKDDHFFAALSAFSVVIVYTLIYWLFKPTLSIHLPLDEVPPAGFIYALLLPLIWIVSALWSYLSQYRFAFYVVVLVSLFLSLIATRPFIEDTIGGPAHTYDVVPRPNLKPLEPRDLFASLEKNGQKTLIMVAASGGGILAAGWTAQVLTQLHQAHPDFPKELRLISSVSGGSVGAAYYVKSLAEISRLNRSEQKVALNEVANDAMRSSLASTAYGVAFPDFKRAIWPFWVDQEFDRGRLLEADWRRIANCRKEAAGKSITRADFRKFCRGIKKDQQDQQVWISTWRDEIANGDKPAIIFNATVMETGERIAITPLATLKRKWEGLTRASGEPDPPRHDYARTLSEFLAGVAENEAFDPAKVGGGGNKEATCRDELYKNGYDIDLWTAARMSATFSYVSPAAHAVCLEDKIGFRASASKGSLGRLHLIDGGYHDNYGVASALDGLAAAMEAYEGDLPVSRIVLIEIRAKPDIPEAKARTEWSSAWLGPFWGLFNSWGFAQLSSDDTAVSRLIARFKNHLEETKRGVSFESFVFVPDWTGPLSWYLSEEQKTQICLSWSSPNNQAMLKQLIHFLNEDKPRNAADIANSSAPVFDSNSCNR